jgi:hypothetical protein
VNKTASVYWGGALFSGDSRTIESENPAYYENLAKVGAILSQGAYDIPNDNSAFLTKYSLQKNLEILGFTNIDTHNGGAVSYPAHAFATQEITVNGEKQNLVLVAIRGSYAPEDWYTDIALADADGDYPKEHEGFATARDNILINLELYMVYNEIGAKNSKILVTGHSYGAAVANLLSKSLEDTFAPEDIYGYTYATPNNIVIPANSNSTRKNIHNFRNMCDIITKLPITTDNREEYVIYGKYHFFSPQNNYSLNYMPGIIKYIDYHHKMTTYINYILSMNSEITVTPQASTLTRISGSADVTVTSNGEVLGSITGGVADENSQIPMIQIGGETYILDTDTSTSTTEKAPIKINITPTSSENVSVGIIGYDQSGEISNQKTYTDIPTENSKIIVNIPADNSENSTLEKVDGEGNVTPIEEDKNTEPTEPSEPIDPTNFEYTIIDDTVKIEKYLGTDEYVEIPAYIEGFPVTALGEYSFRENQYIKEVIIPDTVTTIGVSEGHFPPGAFQWSTIEKIKIPDSVTMLGLCTFSECHYLKDVTLPKNIDKISSWLFDSARGLETLKIPDGVKIIDYSALTYTDSLKRIYIPASVEEIGLTAFKTVAITSKTTIYGYVNSFAQTYATENNIPFIAIDEVPEEIGDVNQNGRKTISDLILILKYCTQSIELTTEQHAIADLYLDRKVDVVDLLVLVNYLLGVEPSLPVYPFD